MAVWSKINISDLTNEKRLDAEYFKPVYLYLEKKLNRLNTVKFGLYTNRIKCGPFGSTIKKETYQKNGVIVARPFNINNMQFEYDDIVYISSSDCKKKNLQMYQRGDIFFSRVGDIRTGIVTENREITISPNIIAVQLDTLKINPYYVSVYFNTEVGELQIQRGLKVVAQPTISTSLIKNLKIVLPDKPIQDEIGDLLRTSILIKNNSNNLYQQATDLLNKELGLNDIVFEKKKSYTARISEVIDSRRMNAEYFSPSIKLILKQPFLADSSPLSAIFQIIRGATPSQYYKEGVPVLKTKNVRLPEIDMEKVQDYVLSTSGLVTIEENDLLLASMGVGSLGRMSFIHEIDQKSIVDGTIRILRKKKTTPRNYEIPTLLFLSSKVGQELIYRGIVGSTGIISLPDDYLYRIPIPKFTQELCDNVTTLVKQSIDAKRESKRLLEQAKLRVEQLIEEAANKQ